MSLYKKSIATCYTNGLIERLAFEGILYQGISFCLIHVSDLIVWT